MLKHTILLADGTVLTSGTGPGQDAIRSIRLTEQVNDETDLVPGAACASWLEAELWAPANRLQIARGDPLTLLQTDTDTGVQRQVGVFLAEQPAKASANVCRVTAYDRMTLLDRDISDWLRTIQDRFPLPLAELVRQVCARCGVTLADDLDATLPQAGYPVRRFYADGLTGRQLIQWAGQIACRFARMTPEGRLAFRWYIPAGDGDEIAPDARAVRTQLRLAQAVLRTARGEIWRFGRASLPYLQGGLTYQDYDTAPLDKVQIRQSDADVGVIYPPDETGTNALVLQGNLLLTAASADEIRPVAQYLYETLRELRYRPLSVKIQAVGGLLPAVGSGVRVRDAYGGVYDTWVMQRTLAGQALTLEATGNARRDATTAVNARSYRNLDGKMLEIRADIDGLDIKASQLAGDYTRLNLAVEGITARTENLEGDYTQLGMTVEGITARTEDLEGNYTQLGMTVNGITARTQNLEGDYSQLGMTVNGLSARTGTLEGNYSQLDLTVDGLSSRTQNLQGDYTALQQNVNGLDLSVVKKGQVRTQFAADANSVTVNSGLVSFAANTLAIDSTNFKLTREGNVSASGTFDSVSGSLRSSVRNGGFYSYANEQICAAIYGYTEQGQDMGSARFWGLTNSGGRSPFAVIRAQTNGGAFALTDAYGEQNVQIEGGTIIARALGVTGTKNRIVATSYGRLMMHSLESPCPGFQDWGTGACGADGLCLLTLDPRLAETLDPRRPPLWQVTPTAPGTLWVENGAAAVVHGAPGQTFNWTVTAPQRDYADQYAETWQGMTPPEPEPTGATLAALEEPDSGVEALLWQQLAEAWQHDNQQGWEEAL